jgi:hypothetical protein
MYLFIVAERVLSKADQTIIESAGLHSEQRRHMRVEGKYTALADSVDST